MVMAITLTESAANRVKRYMAERSPAVGLRFGIKTTGCSGFAYVVDIADSIGPEDHVYESNQVKVIVDPKSMPFVDGTRIDYRGDAMSESFQFDNPNVKSQCGCGESFSV
jgi:iron-sulfur cluster assembly protein